MDLSSIFSTIMSKEGIGGIAEKTGASSLDIKNVLSSALPKFFSGADKQNTNSDTQQGFVNALSQHAASDTTNITSFLGNVDLTDGAKIVGHLLGKDGSDNVAAQTGVNSANTSNILSSAAPMFMSLLGKQFNKEKRSMGTHIVDDGNGNAPDEETLKKMFGNLGEKKAVSGSIKPASQSRKASIKAASAGSGSPKKLVKKKID